VKKRIRLKIKVSSFWRPCLLAATVSQEDALTAKHVLETLEQIFPGVGKYIVLEDN